MMLLKSEIRLGGKDFQEAEDGGKGESLIWLLIRAGEKGDHGHADNIHLKNMYDRASGPKERS